MTFSVFMYSQKEGTLVWAALCEKTYFLHTCKNKGTYHLRDDSAPNKRPLSLYIKPFTFLIGNFKPPAIFCGCSARFMSDGNPEDGFSRDRV